MTQRCRDPHAKGFATYGVREGKLAREVQR
jgi:hypothetical protein